MSQGGLYAEGTSGASLWPDVRWSHGPSVAAASRPRPDRARHVAPRPTRIQQSDALRARAATELYNLDHERAIATFREAIAADPHDAAAHRGLASALWIAESFRRGTMTVDSYLGGVSRAERQNAAAAARTADEFESVTGRAIDLARKRVAANPSDPDAHYQLGAAIGLRASYAATVEGSVRAAFGAAREAYDAHERVLGSIRAGTTPA